jgi:NADH:ubiquinone oxidoreductase subunit F (NADH-binding)
MLAGAGRLDALSPGARLRRVYCLGYCDRSPAVLLPDGRVAAGESAWALARAGTPPSSPPGPPSIRCRSREAIVTQRIARGDFSELGRARSAGVYEALAGALGRPREEILATVERSGERGRGGAGFPTGTKWRRCAEAPGEEKVVIANGDEGDPGSFIDRVLLEQDPHSVLEGLALCAVAVGAREGIVYVRSEYPEARERVERAVREARAAGILGPSLLGSSLSLEVRVVSGMGSYVCGEETAMLNALEGRRGEVRPRPPYPAAEGLRRRPTVVNNVETLVNVPWIVARGADAYGALGTPESRGTKALCLSRGFARPGIVEVEFGIALRDVVEEEAGGGAGGRKLEAVLLGGPMGSVVLPREWDVPVCYGAMADRGIVLGHGGLVAVEEGVDPARLVEHWLEFMAEESCGKCVPCRLGSRRALELARGDLAAARERLDGLLDVVASTSLCAFGQLMPGPVRTLLRGFGDRSGGGSS